MNTGELISLSSSIAAFITSGIALFNVIELIKQRKQSLKPDVIFKEPSFSIYNGSNSPIPLRWVFSANDANEQEAFSLECFNIGLGSCKKINLKWSYDIDKMVTLILKNNNENVYRIDYNSEKHDIIINSKTRQFYFSKLDLQNKSDYILPASVNKEPTKFFLPSSYHVLCSILLDLYFSSDSRENVALIDWPILSLEINYEDIASNKYTKKLQFIPKVFFVQQRKEDTEPCARGYFEINI